jgi:general secretion pathway protein D
MRFRHKHGSASARHVVLTLRRLCCLLIALTAACWAASVSDVAIAKRLGDRARQAYRDGQTVRSYLLFVEAAKRDPFNPTYRENRDALETTARLLIKEHVETADIAGEIKAAEEAVVNPDSPLVPMESPKPAEKLASLPHVEASLARHSFDLRGDETALFEKVAAAYGVRAVWDPQLERGQNIQFRVDDVDWRGALDALTAVTNTFVFPNSAHSVFFARNSEEKRNELEPVILLTLSLPDAVDEKDLVEAANAVRGVLNLRSFGWDSVNHTLFIRDRVSRAQAARNLLETVVLPKAQVALEVQFLTVDSTTNYHYGFGPQTAFQLFNLGHIGNLQQILPSSFSASSYLGFTGLGMLLAVGITDANVFASYSKSFTTATYDATIITDDGGTASLHVGEKYPIPTSLYAGAAQTAGSIYNPIGQVSQEDLGLILKMTPRINGEGSIALAVEAKYKSLGAITPDTIPAVNQREFTGNVTLREGQWAILTGMDEKSASQMRNGFAGLSGIRGLNQVLSENTRSKETSDTLVVIKPVITRLPMSPELSPQYLLGPLRGARVLL